MTVGWVWVAVYGWLLTVGWLVSRVGVGWLLGWWPLGFGVVLVDDPRALRLSLHGPAVTAEDAREAGEATADLLNAMSRRLGFPVGWAVRSVEFICDGCGATRQGRPRPGEGWTYRDGDDLCPDCSR